MSSPHLVRRLSYPTRMTCFLWRWPMPARLTGWSAVIAVPDCWTWVIAAGLALPCRTTFAVKRCIFERAFFADTSSEIPGLSQNSQGTSRWSIFFRHEHYMTFDPTRVLRGTREATQRFRAGAMGSNRPGS